MEPARHAVWGLQGGAARCCSDGRGCHIAHAPPSAPCWCRAPARFAAARAAGCTWAGRAGRAAAPLVVPAAGGGRPRAAGGAARRPCKGRLTRLRRAARCSRRCCWRGCKTSGTPGSRACPSTRSCTRPPCGAAHDSHALSRMRRDCDMCARMHMTGRSATGPCSLQLLRLVVICDWVFMSPQSCTSSAAHTLLFCPGCARCMCARSHACPLHVCTCGGARRR